MPAAIASTRNVRQSTSHNKSRVLLTASQVQFNHAKLGPADIYFTAHSVDVTFATPLVSAATEPLSISASKEQTGQVEQGMNTATAHNTRFSLPFTCFYHVRVFRTKHRIRFSVAEASVAHIIRILTTKTEAAIEAFKKNQQLQMGGDEESAGAGNKGKKPVARKGKKRSNWGTAKKKGAGGGKNTAAPSSQNSQPDEGESQYSQQQQLYSQPQQLGVLQPPASGDAELAVLLSSHFTPLIDPQTGQPSGIVDVTVQVPPEDMQIFQSSVVPWIRDFAESLAAIGGSQPSMSHAAHSEGRLSVTRDPITMTRHPTTRNCSTHLAENDDGRSDTFTSATRIDTMMQKLKNSNEDEQEEGEGNALEEQAATVKGTTKSIKCSSSSSSKTQKNVAQLQKNTLTEEQPHRNNPLYIGTPPLADQQPPDDSPQESGTGLAGDGELEKPRAVPDARTQHAAVAAQSKEHIEPKIDNTDEETKSEKQLNRTTPSVVVANKFEETKLEAESETDDVNHEKADDSIAGLLATRSRSRCIPSTGSPRKPSTATRQSDAHSQGSLDFDQLPSPIRRQDERNDANNVSASSSSIESNGTAIQHKPARTKDTVAISKIIIPPMKTCGTRSRARKSIAAIFDPSIVEERGGSPPLSPIEIVTTTRQALKKRASAKTCTAAKKNTCSSSKNQTLESTTCTLPSSARAHNDDEAVPSRIGLDAKKGRSRTMPALLDLRDNPGAGAAGPKASIGSGSVVGKSRTADLLKPSEHDSDREHPQHQDSSRRLDNCNDEIAASFVPRMKLPALGRIDTGRNASIENVVALHQILVKATAKLTEHTSTSKQCRSAHEDELSNRCVTSQSRGMNRKRERSPNNDTIDSHDDASKHWTRPTVGDDTQHAPETLDESPVTEAAELDEFMKKATYFIREQKAACRQQQAIRATGAICSAVVDAVAPLDRRRRQQQVDVLDALSRRRQRHTGSIGRAVSKVESALGGMFEAIRQELGALEQLDSADQSSASAIMFPPQSPTFDIKGKQTKRDGNEDVMDGKMRSVIRTAVQREMMCFMSKLFEEKK